MTSMKQKITKSLKGDQVTKDENTKKKTGESKPVEKKSMAKVVKNDSKLMNTVDLEKVVPIEEPRFAEAYTECQETLKTLKDMIYVAAKQLKALETAYNYDIKKTKKNKQKRLVPHKPTGFAKPQKIPKELAKFIGVPSGTELTGPKLTSKIWDQLKARKLTYDKDNRVFRTDDEVSALFKVPKSVNKSTYHRDDNGFNFCNLQRFIKNAFPKKEDDVKKDKK